MAEDIGDFETENLITNFKFRLTNWTLDQYQSFSIGLLFQTFEKSCLQKKCLKLSLNPKDPQQSIKELNHCVKDCEAGSQEVMKMQQKHCEVARLTYAKNIQRCQMIHGSVAQENSDKSQSDFNPTALSHCITHNTDKVDRRFFGYYNNQKLKLMNKYC